MSGFEPETSYISRFVNVEENIANDYLNIKTLMDVYNILLQTFIYYVPSLKDKDEWNGADWNEKNKNN